MHLKTLLEKVILFSYALKLDRAKKMIIQTLCVRQINFRKLIYSRHFSCICTKKPILSTPINYKNDTLSTHFLGRSVSSVSTATLPSWFVALSNSTPVAYAQQFVISFHEITGTPWWASIMLSAVALRFVVTLPLTVYQVGKI